MNVVEELRYKGVGSARLKQTILSTELLRERLFKETEFLRNTRYDNFDDRYKFLRLGGNHENYRCPYCGEVRKMGQSLLCDTCGKKNCMTKNQHLVKINMHKNMSQETKNNIEKKKKETCLNRYGVEYATQFVGMKQKSMLTKRERYGNENYTNTEKRIQTNNVKYGGNAPLCDISIKQKVLKTVKERYGVENVFQNDFVKEKIKATNNKRYGVDYPTQSKELCKKIDYNKSTERQLSTKIKNHTLHTSKQEQQIFEWLKEKYKNVKKQYTDDRYINPTNGNRFRCDFYLEDFDLFIEYQGTYHHGKEAFNENNIKHIEKLTEWIKRSQRHINSDYNEAIKVWTLRDPLKRQVAANNKLNYLEIWPNNDKCPPKEEIIKIVSNKITEIE